jgi:hypothetical protein
MAAGAVSGALIGLFFHREDWLGGYGSFRRRMLRLGHVAFFGLGILNVLFAVTAATFTVPAASGGIAAGSLAAGAIVMPACCFLTAWRDAFRRLFPIPVVLILGGIAALLEGWLRS